MNEQTIIKQKSIRKSLLQITVSFLAGITLLITSFNILYFRFSYASMAADRSLAIAESVRKALEPGTDQAGKAHLENAGEYLDYVTRVFQGVEYVFVSDANQKVVLKSGNSRMQADIQENMIYSGNEGRSPGKRTFSKGRYFETILPVRLQHGEMLDIHVGFPKELINGRARKVVLFNIVLLFLSIVAFLSLFQFSINQRLTKPLRRMITRLGKNSPETGMQETGMGFTIYRHDEMGALSLALNQFVRKMHSEINSLKEQLKTFDKTKMRLTESELKFMTLFENAGGAIFITDVKSGTILDCNKQAEELLGIPKAAIVGNHHSSLYSEEFQEKYKKVFENHDTKEKIVDFEAEIPRPDGIMIPVLIASQIIEIEKTALHIGLFIDITEKRMAEKQLATSEEKHRLLAETLNSIIWTMDMDHNYTYISPGVEKLRGYTVEEAMRLKIENELTEESFGIFENTVAELIHSTSGAGESRISCRIDLDYLTKEGRGITTETTIAVLTDERGNPNAIQGITRRITDLTQTEILMRAKVAAESASDAKSNFLAAMSHEIRTPLNAIVGMVDVIMEKPLDDSLMNIINMISIEAGSLLNIVNDILDISKIEAGKVELENISFDLEVLIEGVVESLVLRAEQKGILVKSFISPKTETRLMGDPGRLRQVLINLIGNAVKFTSEGEVFIHVEPLETRNSEVRIQFSVKDTGIGIPKEKQKFIFEGFTQADCSTTRIYGGSGLGTKISRQLVELMGGTIRVESEVGKGSTFFFDGIFQKQRCQEKDICNDNDRDKLKGIRVLVADASSTNRFIIKEYLNSLGCVSEEAETGNAVLERLTATSIQNPFHVLMVDIFLPEIDGYELAKRVRAVPELTHMGIIATTSFGRVGDGKKSRETGINGYLSNPVRYKDLELALKAVLGFAQDGHPRDRKLVTKHSITEAIRKDVSVLLVEDYPTNQKVARTHLSSAGYQVETVKDGQEAVSAWEKQEYDLILMDIQMPVMDGYTAARLIRKKEKEENKAYTPIIAMTAHALSGARERCLEAGMDDYISKPIRRKDLISIADHWTKPFDKQTVHIEPIDIEKGVEGFEGDTELFFEVAETFLHDLEKQTDTIDRFIIEENFQQVVKTTHSIRGGAANLFAEGIFHAAAKMEDAAEKGCLEKNDPLIKEMKKEIYRLREYLDHLKQ